MTCGGQKFDGELCLVVLVNEANGIIIVVWNYLCQIGLITVEHWKMCN